MPMLRAPHQPPAPQGAAPQRAPALALARACGRPSRSACTAHFSTAIRTPMLPRLLKAPAASVVPMRPQYACHVRGGGRLCLR